MIPLDDGTVTTSVMLAIIQALILLGIQAVAEQLVAEVNALTGPRYARDDVQLAAVRWGAQHGGRRIAPRSVRCHW